MLKEKEVMKEKKAKKAIVNLNNMRAHFRVMAVCLTFGCFISFQCAKADSDMEIKVDVSSNSAYDTHLSANEFADRVGKILKTGNFKVHDIHIVVEVNPSSSKGQYRMLWRCGIRSVNVGEKPDRYFDNRGAFMLGKTSADAKRAAEDKIRDTNRVESARKAFVAQYGNVNVPAKGGVLTACSTDGGKKGLSKNNEVWCLQNVVLIATDR